MSAYILNLMDLLFTIHALRNGAAELNPLMQSVPVMIVYKTVIAGFLIWWLAGRTEALGRWGLRLCEVAYGLVDLWHIVNIAALWAV